MLYSMDIVNQLPIPLQRNVLARITLVDLLGDMYLDNYMIKHRWFCPREVICYCMEKNLIQTLKVFLNHKHHDFDISEYHFMKCIGHAIMNEHFEALYIFLNIFTDKVFSYQSEIWNTCDKIKKNEYVMRCKPKNTQKDWLKVTFFEAKLQVFYEMMIRFMHQHDRLNEVMWDRLDISVLSPREDTKIGVFQRLLKARMLDTYLLSNQLVEKFYFVPIELIDTLLRLNLSIANKMIDQYIYNVNIENLDLNTLKRLQDLGFMEEFVCHPLLLKNLFDKASVEVFTFLGNYASNYGFSLIIDEIILSRNMDLWRYVHTKFPKYLFDDVTVDLHDVYTIPTDTDCIPSENAPFIIEFFNIHKIIVNADIDQWLMLAIDADDSVMAAQLLTYPISKDDLVRPFKYTQRLGRTCIEQMIMSKIME